MPQIGDTVPSSRRLAPALVAAPLLALALAACGSDGDGSGGSATPTTVTPTSEAPDTPSATDTPSPPTQQDLEESVSAETERIRSSASAQLEDAEGQGGAMEDVSVQGVPTANTGDLRTGLVRVTNPTDEAAFYAVQVDFVAGDGTVVDTVVAGFPNVGPGEQVERYVSSRTAGGSDTPTTPRIAKAERS
ncbi:hypothetical protein [Streptomyces sp. NPDC090026]|uniref:hypothetical protein n=1 Tax=Streptomyces sp. NPDC090026 TaxID=3365923 RepID=UPI00382E2A78